MNAVCISWCLDVGHINYMTNGVIRREFDSHKHMMYMTGTSEIDCLLKKSSFQLLSIPRYV